MEAVRAYHAVLGKLGLKPTRKLDDDLLLTDQSMSYAGTGRAVVVKGKAAGCACTPSLAAHQHSPAAGAASCACGHPAKDNGQSANGEVGTRAKVTESYAAASRQQHVPASGQSAASNGRPDFSRMTSVERLAYHRQRLGLGR